MPLHSFRVLTNVLTYMIYFFATELTANGDPGVKKTAHSRPDTLGGRAESGGNREQKHTHNGKLAIITLEQMS